MDTRTRVGSGDPLSQPWVVVGIGGCYDITKTPAVDTTFLLPSVLPESDINPALCSLQMVAVECSAYEHGLPGLKPPSATGSVTLDHFYNLSVPQFPHGL